MDRFPVAIRELMLASRRAAIYWSRCLSGLVAILICTAMLFAGFGGLLSPYAAGRGLFGLLCFVGWLLALAGGVICTADSLSREKREGTLGLLFLTDLNSFEVVGGKLVAQSWSVLYCIMAALPIPGLAFFIGGVDCVEYLGAAVACVNTLFFAANLGLLMSAISNNTWRSLAGAFAAVAILCFILPGIGWETMTANKALNIDFNYLWPGPTGAFLAVLFPALTVDRMSVYVLSLAMTHFYGWLFFFLAGFILDRNWREKGGLDKQDALAIGKGRKHENSQSFSRRFMLDDHWWEVNPVFRMGVLISRDSRLIKGVLLGICLCWLTGMVLFSRNWVRTEVVLVVGFLIHCFIKTAMAVDASKAFSEDRRSGLLELVLTTPMNSGEIVRGKILALKRQYLMPIALVVFIDIILFISGIPYTGRADLWMLLLVGGCGIGFLVADLYVMAWAGLWFGLKTNNTWRAVRQTVLFVLILPWCIWLMCMALLGGLSNGSFGSDAGLLGFGVAIVMFATNYVGMVGWASNHLNDDFRMAVERL